MIKRLFTALLFMILTFSLTSCSKYDVKKYQNEVDLSLFKTEFEEKIKQYDNRNFTLEINEDYKFKRESIKNDKVKSKEITKTHNNSKISVDFDSKIINQEHNSTTKTTDKNNEGVSESNRSVDLNLTYQENDLKFIRLDNNNMIYNYSTSFDSVVLEYNMLKLFNNNLNTNAKYYIDSNVYTVFYETNDTTTIIQVVLKKDYVKIIITNNSTSDFSDDISNYKTVELNEICYEYHYKNLSLNKKDLTKYIMK